MSASRPDSRGPSTRRYTAIIAAAFGLTVLAAAALTTLYALGGQPQIEGTLIFAMLAGLAIGFVLWGNHLMPQGPFVLRASTLDEPGTGAHFPQTATRSQASVK